MTVDGVDFLIEEPSDFSSEWYSHKFDGPGVQYKIAVSIVGGNICWINGPFQAGAYNDLKIFRLGLMNKLDEHKYVEADHGYEGQPDKVRLPFEAQNKAKIARKGKARARHKSINKLLKQFKALSHCWRHSVMNGQHKVATEVVVLVVQLSIELGVIKPFKCAAPYKKKYFRDIAM